MENNKFDKNIDQQLNDVLKRNESLKQAIHKNKKLSNPKNIKKSMKQKSIFSAILLLILVLTGTFAWQSYQQRAINPFYDPSGNHGVRFHDRLELSDDPLRAAEGFANMVNPNLNIFAENFGDMDVFVRIQLREFFAMDNDDYGFYDDTAAVPVPAVRENPNTWPIFRTSATNINQRRWSTPAYRMGHEEINLILGQPAGDEGRIVYMPTFNRAVQPADPGSIQNVPGPFHHPNAYRMSEATGAAVDWFTNYTIVEGGIVLPTLPSGTSTYIQDHIRYYTLHGIPTGPGITEYYDGAHIPLTPQRRRELDDGSDTAWNIPEYLESYRLYTDNTIPTAVELLLSDNPVRHYAQENLAWYVEGFTPAELNTALSTPQNPDFEFRGVMTIRQWIDDLDMPTGNFWLHDSENEHGFFYWMGYLTQGTNPEAGVTNATSLLVEALELPTMPNEWEYALTMMGEAFTRQALGALEIPISDQAMQIFNVIAPDGETEIGGNITIDENGNMTYISQSLVDAGVTLTGTGNTRTLNIPPNSNVNPNLVNITAHAYWSVRLENGNFILTREVATGIEYRMEFNETDPLTVSQGSSANHDGVSIERRYLDEYGDWSDWAAVPSPATTTGTLTFTITPAHAEISANATQVTAGDNAPLGTRTLTASWQGPEGGSATATRDIYISDSMFPAAATGTNRCPATGTADNIWEDTTGIEWCVIATSGNYSMLLTRHVHGVEMAHGAFAQWGGTTAATRITENTAGPAIRNTVINPWWNNNANVSPELRAAAVHANIPIQRTAAGATPNNQTIAQNTANLSTPRSGTQNGLPFFLSYADVLHRVDGTINAGTDTAPGTPANRIANRLGGTGAAAHWFLREASSAATSPVGIINSNGNWSFTNATNTTSRGFRLGVWVRH